jgi:hypothetical protein
MAISGVHLIMMEKSAKPSEGRRCTPYPCTLVTGTTYTDKRGKKIFLIYKEIQIGAVAKSYMRKGFLIYEEMRKYLVIYEEAFSHI